MGLPVQTDLTGLDFLKNGQPWCKVPARAEIDPSSLDIVKGGQPWVVNPYGAAGAAITGTMAGTLGSVTGEAAGKRGGAGTLAGALSPVTGLISGVRGTAGEMAGTLAPVTGQAAGVRGAAGALAGTLAPVTGAGAGIRGTAGAAAGTLGQVSGAMSGVRGATGDLVGALTPVIGSFSGTLGVTPFWQFPTFFSEYGFGYGDYDPGMAASIAIGCLHIYMKTGDERANTWARRILDDLRLNRLDPDYGGYKSDRHYGWLTALALQTFGLAVNGAAGRFFPFADTPDNLGHFNILASWVLSHSGDEKPNVLNSDLIPYTYSEAGDLWDYAPHYLATGQMGTLEAVVLMLGAALEYGKAGGGWDWFNRLLSFIVRDNLVALTPAQIRAVTAYYDQVGAANLVRLRFADYDRDSSKYCESWDQAAIDNWGEQAVDLDFRYGSPVILEDPAAAQLLATRLLQRLLPPLEVAEVETWLEGTRIELGDTVAVSSAFHGWDQEEFTVQGKDLDLGRRRVNLKLSRPLDHTESWAMDAAGSASDAWAIDQAGPWDEHWDSRALIN
jgi:hypothetical protein